MRREVRIDLFAGSLKQLWRELKRILVLEEGLKQGHEVVILLYQLENWLLEMLLGFSLTVLRWKFGGWFLSYGSSVIRFGGFCRISYVWWWVLELHL